MINTAIPMQSFERSQFREGLLISPLQQAENPGGESATPILTEKQAIAMEILLSKSIIENFRQNLSGAHAIVLAMLLSVGIVGFLQPPTGWDASTGKVLVGGGDMRGYFVCNILNVCVSSAGLVWYLFCIYTSVFSIENIYPEIEKMYSAVAIKASTEASTEAAEREANEVKSQQVMGYINHLRSCLRCAILPVIAFRTLVLLFFVYFSIFFSVLSFFYSAIISIREDDRRQNVVVPFVFGSLLLIGSCFLCYVTLVMHFRLGGRFHSFWLLVAKLPEPELVELHDDVLQLLDPIFMHLRHFGSFNRWIQKRAWELQRQRVKYQ